MGLADKLEQPVRKQRKCAAQKLLDSLPEEERAAVEQALGKVKSKVPGFTGIWLASVLSAEGHPISDMSIYRHLSERCGCDPK